MEVSDSSNRGILIGQKRYEGYCIDLIDYIAKEVGFKYNYEVIDGPQGSFDPKTKTWNGLIRRLLDRVRDILYLQTLFKKI